MKFKFENPGSLIHFFVLIASVLSVIALVLYNYSNSFGNVKIPVLVFLLLNFLTALVLFLYWRSTKFKLITKEYEFEKEKNILQKHYEYLLKYSNDIILLLDEEGKIQQVNEKTLDVYGYKKEELIGKTGNIFQDKKLKSVFDNILKQDNPNAFIYKSSHRKKNGEVFPVEVRLHTLFINDNKYIQVIARDITELDIAERVIHEHSIMLDSVGQSVIATDLQGNILYWNKASEKLYGWSKEEVQSENIFSLMSNIKNQFCSLQILEVLRRGENWYGEFAAMKKDGKLFPNKITHSPVLNSYKELIAIITVSEDLSDREKREKEILFAKQKAEELNHLKSTFLSNMSHELRTPLIGILGYAEMILDEENDEALREKVGIIYKSGKKLNETLDTILDISRMESSKVDVKKELFNLNELISQSVTLYRVLAEEKGVSLRYFSGTNGLMVEFDRRLFSKIINSLLSNAVKYTYEGEIVLSTNLLKDKIEIIVEDTGIGIPEDKLNTVFEPFRQASEGFQRRFEGTGLGLTITKMFVEKMNGTIYVESSCDTGSKFTIEFPIKHEYKLNIEIPER